MKLTSEEVSCSPAKVQLVKKKQEIVKAKPAKIHEHEEEISDDSTDLTVRLHFSQAIKPEKLPMIYEEIAKAIDSAIRKMDDPEK